MKCTTLSSLNQETPLQNKDVDVNVKHVTICVNNLGEWSVEGFISFILKKYVFYSGVMLLERVLLV